MGKRVWWHKFVGSLLLSALLVLGVGTGPGKASVWGTRDPNYAVLPGVSIGAIAVGMPLSLARKAALRYGPETQQTAGEYQYGPLSFTWDEDGKVDVVAADGDSRFYVVVPGSEDDFLHVASAGCNSVLDVFGEPSYISDDGSLGYWKDFGLAVFVSDDCSLVLSVAVYRPGTLR